VTQYDWYAWHDGVSRERSRSRLLAEASTANAAQVQPDSGLARRLVAVRERVRLALDDAPGGTVRVLSLVAGQGRELLPVIAAHPRRADVRACLVELDPRNAEVAREQAAAAGLSTVEVRERDAGLVDGYADAAPADLLLLSGLFGNITDDDIRHTVAHSAALTRRGGTVIWTRHRRPPDLVPQIDAWFTGQGFDRLWLAEAGLGFGAGAYRAVREPAPLVPGTRLFTFRKESPCR
jgi:hypothetical protein